MTDQEWRLGPADGELIITTGVAGRLATLGHRLTIAMTAWSATVSWNDGQPCAVDLTVETVSLKVLRSQGGVKSVSGPEKALARANALKSLDAKKFPEIRFHADRIEKVDDGYRLSGALSIHGTSRDRVIDLHAEDRGDTWRLSCAVEVSQSEFGVKPYSMMMGAVSVADQVTVSFGADTPKSD